MGINRSYDPDAADPAMRQQGADRGIPQEATGYTQRSYDPTQYGGGQQDTHYSPGPHEPTPVGRGSADTELSRIRGLGAAAANRQAYQVDFGAAQQDRAQGLQARNLQADALWGQRDAARGNVPSRAEIQGAQVGGQSLDAAMAAGAGARSGGLAAAQAAAQRGQGGMQLGGIGQESGLRSQEMGQAIGAYGHGATGIRSGDYASQGMSQQQAEAQAQSENFQRRLNQQGQMGYEQMGVNLEQDQVDASTRMAAIRNKATASGIAASDANKARALGVYTAGAGAMGTLIGDSNLGNQTAPSANGDGGNNPDGTTSDARAKRNTYSFSDAHAKRGAYMLSDAHSKEQIESLKAEKARAWDEGHAAAVANVEKASRWTPEEIKRYSEGNEYRPEVAAVRGIKTRAWDEGHAAAPGAVPMAPPPRAPMPQVVAPPQQEQPMASANEGAPPSRLGQLASHARAMVSDGDAKDRVVPLYEDAGTERHWDRDVSKAKPDVMSGASLSAPTPKYSRETETAAKPGLAAASQRKWSDAELEKMGREMQASQRVQNDARLGVGPTVGARQAPPAWLQREMEPGQIDPMTDALADGLAPHSYEYKPEYAKVEGQRDGEKNVGIMAQNAEKNPITGVIVEKDKDGMRRINLKKATSLSLAAAGHNAQKLREQQAQIDDLKGGG